MSTRHVQANRSQFWVWSIVVLACTLGLAGTYILCVEAPPPRHIVIAAGSRDGAYFRFAERYAELLKQEQVTLDIRVTEGSVENVELLLDKKSDVEVAFVQTGIVDPEKSSSLQALGSLYREPLWIFYRGAETIDRLTQLKGLRIAIGHEGSGTRAIATQLLAANGIEENDAELIEMGGSAAADALEDQKVDVAFFVAGIETPFLRRLLTADGIRMVELSQVEAYQRQFRFLSTVTIHEGLIDVARNIPTRNTVLIAPAATLIAHSSLHPALASLLLKVATKVHRGANLLASSGEFPSPSLTDLPLSEEAERFFRVGPPVLQRILPFWMASMADRLKVMMIPLIMLLMPLFRMTPPLVRWQTRRRIYMWYGRLRKIDQQAIHGMELEQAMQSMTELQLLEKQIAHVGVPLSYMEEYYNLRVHLNFVCAQVGAIIERHSVPKNSPGLHEAVRTFATKRIAS